KGRVGSEAEHHAYHPAQDVERVDGMDTCNLLLARALAVFSGPGGINDQLASISLDPVFPPVGSFLRVSTPMESYEKSAAVKYPVATLYCERLKNTQMEKFRLFSGTALLVFEIRVSSTNAEELDASLNSYVQAACQVLENARGTWTEVGMYA